MHHMFLSQRLQQFNLSICQWFPGLAFHDLPREHYSVSTSACLPAPRRVLEQPPHSLSISPQINITATLGTLNVAAEVEAVKIKGDGEMHMTLSSSQLPNLNRQLQFVTYTNTLFHPSTADTGKTSKTQNVCRPVRLSLAVDSVDEFLTLCLYSLC